MSSILVQPDKKFKKPLDRRYKTPVAKLLNARQLLFIEAILADPEFNATNAAKKAGYQNPSQNANQLMKNPLVAAEIAKAIKGRMHEYKLEAGLVLKHLANALYLDPIDLFERTETGAYRVKSLDQVPPEIRRCITEMKCKSVETEEGGITTYLEIKLMSKDSAMALAMKHLGLADNVGVQVNVNVGDALLASLLEKIEGKHQVLDAGLIEAKALSSEVT